MENVITLGKLIGLLFCLPSSLLLFVENSKNTNNELARPVMGTIFLVPLAFPLHQKGGSTEPPERPLATDLVCTAQLTKKIMRN